MTILKRLFRYLTPYRGWAIVAFSSMLIFAATQGILAALIRPLFDEVLVRNTPHPGAVSKDERFKTVDLLLKRDQPEGHRGTIIDTLDRVHRRTSVWWAAHPNDRWKWVLVTLVAIFIIRAFTAFFSEYAFQKVGLSTVRDLRNELYESIIQQSHRFFAERSTGELVSRVVSDADAIQAAVSVRMGDLFQESITLVFLVIFIFIASPELAIVSLIVAPIMIYAVATFGERLRRTTHKSQERMADMTTLLEETIRGFRIVKAFTMEKFEIRRFHEATQRHLGWNLKAQKVQALTSPVMELLAGTGIVLLFFYAHSRIQAGRLTPGQFLSFLAALAMMAAPIKKLNKVNLSLNTALSASERVFRMLDVENEVKEKPDAFTIAAVGKGIRYENVTFGYRENSVLRDVNLDVAPGEIVAVVGGSGAGKSTLVNLLPRFYDVTGGRITIDGRDSRDLTLNSLRGLMGFVTQEVILFNDTVRNNIAYGRVDLQEERVVAAARAANAHEFISALPQGYETIIGESGVLLSGGQRQRLAIARALFKDPPILILDEATSALDTESERLVQQALNNLMQGRTTLVIAHRLSTIRSAHKIVVLDAGQIAEVGSHDALLARRGIYRKLYDLQFLDEERPAGAIA